MTDRKTEDFSIEQDVLAAVGAEVMLARGDESSVAEQICEADALLNTWLPIDRELIARLRRCRIIARYGVGTDNIDVAAATDAGIVVTNVPDYCVEEVATHALAMVLTLLRRIREADARVRAGQWGVAGLEPIPRVSSLTIGLVGFGRIARKLASLLSAFECDLLVHDPYLPAGAGLPQSTSLDVLLSSADVVSLHVPHTPETRGLIGARELRLMKPSALLVNTARGHLVDLDALLDALREGRLAGAGLDAFETEPLDPLIVADVRNLIVTPHMAYYSESSSREAREKAATQILKVLNGEQPDYAVVVGTA